MKKSWIVCLTALLFCLLLASCGETPHTHTPVTVKENEVAATCAAEGNYDEVVKCSVCGEELSRTAKTVEKIAHTPVTDVGKEPTVLEDGLTEGSHCDVCGETLVAQTVIPATGGKTAAVSKDMTATADGFTHTVGNAVETFSFLADISVPTGSSYVVARDEYCEQVIHTKTAPLSVGDNVFYLLVTNGNDMKLYTVTIRRLTLYTVSFDLQNGETVPAQSVEEGSLATAPADPSRAGYTFAGWDYDFTKAPTQSLTVKATWTAHTDTTYTVEYYLENLTKNGYDKVETVTLNGTTDTTATAEEKTYEHFKLNTVKSNVSGNIDGDGSRVLKVYYTRNTYTVSVVGDGTATGAGTYPYGTEITLTASARLGYTFGWYRGETLLSDETTLTIPSLEADVDVTAQWVANTDTRYTVEYYLENLKKDGYDKVETVTLNGTTDTVATAEKKTFEHFTWNESESIMSGNIDGDGSRVLKVYYTRNTYTVSVAGNGTVTGAGTYPYGTEVTLTASVHLGYTFGWYRGETLLSDETTLTIPSLEADITARCKVAEDMKPFVFTSTATTCVITKLKNHSIKNVVIPSCVTRIEQGAFLECTSLESITIPDSVTSIDSEAFYRCTSLKSVQIAEDSKLERIGDDVFYGCTSLTSIAIPDSVTSIGSDAFYGCTSLTHHAYNNALYLGNNSNPYLVLVKVKNTSIASCTIHEDTRVISKAVFEDCICLESVQFAEDSMLESIGAYAFRDCTSLESITIPDRVTSIGSSAFRGCTSLESITIPDGVTVIGDGAFYGCTSLTYHTYDNALYLGNKSNPYLVLVKAKNTSITSCTIHEDTRVIYSAFSGCTSLRSITIPDGVTSIGSSAFSDCTSLESITIPDGVTSIGSSAFKGCTRLTSITIPDSVTSIGSEAFCYCTSLKSVTFENPNGWGAERWLEGIMPLSASALTNKATAATYLESTYYSYTWRRK